MMKPFDENTTEEALNIKEKLGGAVPLRLLLMVITVLLTLIIARPSAASEIGKSRTFGIGLMLGSPTGLSMKLFLAPRLALDWGFGVGFFYGPSFSAHMDFLGHIFVVKARSFDLPFYIGVGAKFIMWFSRARHYYWGNTLDNDTRYGVGIRVPFGIAFQLNASPFDIFLEIVPGLGLVPGIGAFLDGAIGFRYYF